MDEYARLNDLKLVSNLTHDQLEWCNKTIPLSYTHVQSAYWNVGFMRYWEPKQIPNFLLASPILVISYLALVSYFGAMNSNNVYSLFGLVDVNHDNSNLYKQFFKNQNLFPFALHLIFLLVSATFFMHVQVKI
jgi:phosphatidylinositol glycan class V